MKTESRDKSRANGACRHPECLSVNVAREFFENSDDRKKLVRVCDLLIIKSPLIIIIIKLLSFLIPLAHFRHFRRLCTIYRSRRNYVDFDLYSHQSLFRIRYLVRHKVHTRNS